MAPTGASVLDRLGLPNGVMDLSASQQLTSFSAMRVGDSFTVQTDGQPAKTISIDTGETLDTLAAKIQRATGQEAKVTLGTIGGMRQMTISPSTGHSEITFGPGKGDADALAQLGIPQGVLSQTILVNGKTVQADGGSQIYGLDLPSTLNLSDKDQVSHTLAKISAALVVIQSAYKALVTAATPANVLAAQAAAQKAATGAVPAYLTAQIKNYQAGLARLTGSSS